MLEDLTTMFSPMLVGVMAVVAVVCFVFGRIGNGASRREEGLRRELLDAKASVPQLESSIRNREQQIARLQVEIGELTDRSNELLRKQEQQNTDLRRARREVRNLTSELNAVRGVRSADDNIVMDGFEDEVAAEPGDSALATQLKKTEALYEKLKGALIKRDERIEELEGLLQGERAPDIADPMAREESTSVELGPLKDKIREQAGVIDHLQEQLSELRREKEMLEDLANRRSRSNRVLKDATAEIEARVPGLEKQIAERDETISAREASIKRLLGEVETARSDIAARTATIEALNKDLDAKARLVETAEQRENGLKSTIAAREERIAALDQELVTTLGVVRTLEKDLADANGRIAEQASAAEQLNRELAKRDQAEATLTSTIRDREFRIDTLTKDKQTLEQSLAAAREAARSAEQSADAVRRDAEDSRRLFEKHQQATVSEKAVAEREARAQKREIEDLQSNLRQHQQWMEKLKASLEEKENRVRESQRQLAETRAELEAAGERLRLRLDDQQRADDARHELEREIVALKSRDEQIRAELAEHGQTIAVYKSMLADRDFRIESLEHEIRTLGTADATAPGDDHIAPHGSPSESPQDVDPTTGTAQAVAAADDPPPPDDVSTADDGSMVDDASAADDAADAGTEHGESIAAPVDTAANSEENAGEPENAGGNEIAEGSKIAESHRIAEGSADGGLSLMVEADTDGGASRAAETANSAEASTTNLPVPCPAAAPDDEGPTALQIAR